VEAGNFAVDGPASLFFWQDEKLRIKQMKGKSK
jgi:hypothetical protein